MGVRRIESKDLSTVNKWLGGRKRKDIPANALPDTGFIVDDVAAGFLYLTNSTAAWIEPVVSNPSAKPREVSRAIRDIIENIAELAKTYGVTTLFGMTTKASMVKTIKRLGFEKDAFSYHLLARRI